MVKIGKKYSLDNSLGHLASQASRIVLKRINQDLAKIGSPITSEQFSALVYVWNQNGQPQYVLADSLNKDKTTMTRLLASLEALGLIVRQAGNHDAREKKVFITDKGNALMHDVTLIVQNILDIGAMGISREHIEISKAVLRKFHSNLMIPSR
jgi:DNA-binding MarR family transcriptional regulator